MAETVVINIEANTQGLQSTIDLLTKLGVVEQKVADEFRKTNEQNVTSLNKNVQATTKEFEKLDKAVKGIKADNQLAKGLDASKEVAKTGASVTSLRKQFQQATKEVEQLTEKFGALDARTLAAAKRAGELGSEIDNINKQIAALTPEGKFQAIQNLGASIAGVFQVATGALQAFGVESEQATKIAQQFQGALNIFGGLSQLTQLKDSLTAVKAALGLTTAATAGATGATELQAAANEKAAVSQTALNTAVLANPYAIALAALVALTGAIVLFTQNSSDAAEEQERLNKALTDVNNQANENVSELTTGIQLLTQEYQNANTTQAERLEISQKLNELAPETIGWFDAEGNAIVDLTTNTQNLIAAKIRQAEAEVLVKEIAKLNTENVKTQNSALEDNISFFDQITAGLKSYITTGNLLNTQVNLVATALDNKGEKLKDNNFLIAGYTKRLEELGGASTAFANTVEKNNEKIDKSNKKTTFVPPQTEAITKAPTAAPITELPVQLPETKLDVEVSYNVNPEAQKEYEANVKSAKEQLEDLKDSVGQLALNTGLDIAFQQIDKLFEEQLDRVNRLKEAQLEAITEEEEALTESYENRKIGKRELEEEQERLARQRIAAEKKAEKEVNEIKRKQDIANRAAALFNIGINTWVAISKTTAELGAVLAAPLIPLLITQGAIQAAAVLAQPLPKYKKGTLSVGGVGSEDTELALLQPGEAVIPTDTNRRYHPAIKAIYHGKIKPEDINNFVNLKLRGDYSASDARPVTAKMDTSDLYALGRIMKKNDGVYVRNIGELAALITDSYNPRR